MSIRHGGSRFARDVENVAQLGYTEWVENVVDSTRFDRIDTTPFLLCRFDIPEVDLSETYIESTSCESSRIVKNLRRIDSSLLSRFKNEEGSCIIISRVLTSGGADQLLTNRVESSHGVDPHYRKSRSVK